MSRFVGSILVAGFLGLAASAGAQEPVADTTLALAPITVTVERSALSLARSTSAVSHLTREDLARFPQATLADALRQVPGVALVDFDGHGFAPQIMVRGFYGGGEAEYVVVLLDGKPVNNVTGGIVRWDQIPAASIERIEVLRGGSSALWGDSAVGAVINVITRPSAEPSPTRWSLAAGAFGTVRAEGGTRLPLGDRALGLSGGLDRTDGFRDGSERNVQRLRASYALFSGEERSLELSLLSHRRDFAEPGPLLDGEEASDRRARSVFHRFDRTEESSHRADLEGRAGVGSRGRLSGSLVVERRNSEAVRTVRLAPDFADTQERVLGTGRVLGEAQLATDGALVEGRDRLTLGWEASYATLRSRYYDVLMGPAVLYTEGAGERGELNAAGRGNRGVAAAFAQYILDPVEAVRFSLGVRGDWIRDRFEPTEPDGGEGLRASRGALSPKAGVNLRWLERGNQAGHLFLTGGRSFKAPTPDQLFDQRRFPLADPPFSASPANPELEPQRGRHVEIGLYHSAAWAQEIRADLSVTAYHINMEDELDFDLQTLRYVNLGESRHRGVEAGLSLAGPLNTRASLSLTVQHATNRAGEFEGNYLKAIPRRVVDMSVSAVPVGRLEAGLRVSHARGVYLDDANTARLSPFTRTDLRLSHPLAGVALFVDVRNLFDAEYSTTGYPDPSGSGGMYLYPAAGRTLELGLRSRTR